MEKELDKIAKKCKTGENSLFAICKSKDVIYTRVETNSLDLINMFVAFVRDRPDYGEFIQTALTLADNLNKHGKHPQAQAKQMDSEGHPETTDK